MFRTDQKARIKEILATATGLDVYDIIKLESDTYPYVFISDLDLISNKDGGSLTDTATYYTVRNYSINCAFYIDNTIDSINAAVVLMNQYEETILNSLRAIATRNDGVHWADLIVNNVSAPFSGTELSLQMNTIVITFTVACETEEVV